MGVPALFRWLSVKYPKIVEQVVEEQPKEVDGRVVPVDISGPNPNGTEFDNLYLDMNGIIHPCCHPENQVNISHIIIISNILKAAPPTEQDMMVEIFKYIDRIMGMVRPRKLLYLAVDGVAPRAKMNQQRSRRFRAAMEASEKLEQQKNNEDYEEDEEDEAAEVFDSNCITPGTPFMKLVSESLKYYTVERLNNDPAWRDVKVIFSDASVPGEGEHKIMDFIRRQRLDPSYDPCTKHVIYGLDADLIMLSMATHEPYFKVLREDVFAEMNNNNNNCRKCKKPGHWADSCPGIIDEPEKTSEADGEYKLIQKPFIFLDIPTLREYLEAEMKPSGEVPFKFNGDRAIDDWIFLCFFVGNDFLPHLPSLEIREGAIDILIDIYKRNASKLGGYICKDGMVNLERVAVIMAELGKVEEVIFRKRREKEERRMDNAKRRKESSQDAEAREEYRRAQIALHQAQQQEKQQQQEPVLQQLPPEAMDGSVDNADLVKKRAELRQLNIAAAKALKDQLQVKETDSTVSSKKRPAVENDEDPADNVRLWEPGAKDRYYHAKFHIDPSTDQEFIAKVARSYVEGLCWVMAYYYQGCPSWKWFYPYHYAPFASDLTEIGSMHIRFELGEPFRPFDQLMGVFPAASSTHIPEPFRPLMTEADSDVIDFYPETFHIDMNGKRAAWQGVALLPFIDETRLLAALERVYPSLTPEQIRLNARGDPRLFSHASRPPHVPQDLSPETETSLVISLDPAECANIAGMVKLDTETCKLNQAYPSPLDRLASVPSVPDCQVRCWHFQLPYHERRNLHFRAQLLPGVRLPDRRLTEDDRYMVQSGAASRAFSSRLVINNGSSSGGGRYGARQPHHSMHQEYNQAQAHRHGSDQPRHDHRHGYDQQSHYQQRPQQPYQQPYQQQYQQRTDQQRHQQPYQQQPYQQQRGYTPPSHHPDSQHHQQQARNPYAALAPSRHTRPEDLYPPPPAAAPPMPQEPQPASSAFHRPQPPAPSSSKPKDNMDDLYGIRRR